MIWSYNYAVILPVRRKTAVSLIKLRKRGSMTKTFFWKGVFITTIFHFHCRTKKCGEMTIRCVGYQSYQVTIRSSRAAITFQFQALVSLKLYLKFEVRFSYFMYPCKVYRAVRKSRSNEK